jgi:uncharacterized protein (TIGR02145 family)
VGINSDGSEPDSRAILDIKSNNKGVLLPRLTDVERNSLSDNIPEGMLIFNITSHTLQIFYNKTWYPIVLGVGVSTLQVTDIDGNVYNTVTIGNQVWMRENLKTTHFNNGDEIPEVTDNTEWSNLTSGAYCSFYNSDAYGRSHGNLYNYYTVVDSRNLCPTGWHIPDTYNEWEPLWIYLGGWNVAGGKLKEAGTTNWSYPNTGADNSSGFCALAAGFRSYNGMFMSFMENGFWWTSTDYNNVTDALNITLYYNYSIIGSGNCPKTMGLSVRCIKN